MEEKQKLIGKTGIYAIIIDDVVRYIGSSVNMGSRKSNHLGLLRHKKHSNKELQALFDKHGEDKFEFYCLDFCDVESLYELERLYIKIHEDTIINKDRVVKLDKHIRSEEESKRLRQKLSDLNSGEGNPNCRLSVDDVKNIIDMKNRGVSACEVANKFNISESYVYDIGKTRWVNVVV